MSSPSMIRSPRLIPIRNSIRWWGSMVSFLSLTASCIWIAASTASTTLANSASSPSPISLTIRPFFSSIKRVRMSWRTVVKRSKVPTSSSAIIRLKPTTSAANMAASLRSKVCPSPPKCGRYCEGNTEKTLRKLRSLKIFGWAGACRSKVRWRNKPIVSAAA